MRVVCSASKDELQCVLRMDRDMPVGVVSSDCEARAWSLFRDLCLAAAQPRVAALGTPCKQVITDFVASEHRVLLRAIERATTKLAV
jgi:hypothetical protein